MWGLGFHSPDVSCTPLVLPVCLKRETAVGPSNYQQMAMRLCIQVSQKFRSAVSVFHHKPAYDSNYDPDHDLSFSDWVHHDVQTEPRTREPKRRDQIGDESNDSTTEPLRTIEREGSCSQPCGFNDLVSGFKT